MLWRQAGTDFMKLPALHSSRQTLKQNNLTCWVIYDAGKVGTANQCLGLASALEFKAPRIIEISARFPWRLLSTKLWRSPLKIVENKDGTSIKPPWPDVIIAAGRAAAAPAAAIRRYSQDKAFAIQLQDPYLKPELFNLVIAPVHDRLTGKNVIVTTGALHRLSKENLRQAAIDFKDQLSSLKHPFIAVLLGGTNKRYTLNPSVIASMAERLKSIARTYDVGLAITPSRRTEPENYEALQTHFKDFPAYIWDRQGENPYMAMLALAQTLIVTSDSVSMVSEACFTGKPVYIYHLPGGAAISARFHTLFANLGYTRPLEDRLEQWTYKPLNDFPYVIDTVRQAFDAHFAALE